MCSFRRRPSAALARTDASVALRNSNGSRRRSSPFSSIRSKEYKNVDMAPTRAAEETESSPAEGVQSQAFFRLQRPSLAAQLSHYIRVWISTHRRGASVLLPSQPSL